ncbi:two-component regulator propeller domain-containing protein [Flammeovirgaceae bacterium SG7u.111]|nr:two-component regulator propeller domain-containing protein [Flammeovirgaceae bacterium SG7u.132]WPO33832.1 two-component regulator propeller domain-containing protein [Flammeovirgaceae bacterium SG7u.111]
MGNNKLILQSIKLYITIALSITAQRGLAQKELSYYAEYLSISEKQPLSHIRAIYKDSLGFMWFGSEDGLIKYDGLSCDNYAYREGEGKSLTSAHIISITSSKGANFWISTLGEGISYYHYHEDRFEHFRHNPTNPNSLISDYVWYVFEDSKQNLWIGTDKGIDYKPAAQDSIFHLTATLAFGSSPKLKYQQFKEDQEGNIWVATSNGTGFFPNGNHEKFMMFRKENIDSQANFTTHIYIDRENTVWIGTLDGLGRFDWADSTFIFQKENGKPLIETAYQNVQYVASYGQDNLLLSINKVGLLIVDKKGTIIKKLNDDIGVKTNFQSSEFRTVYSDESDFIWVSDFHKTIALFTPNYYKVNLLSHNLKDKNSLPHNNVWDILEDSKGNIWISTNGGGISYFDRKNNTFTNYKDIPTNRLAHTLILEEGKGLWVGSWGRGITYFDFKTKSTKVLLSDQKDNTTLKNNQVYYLLKDHKGRMWASTFGDGISVLDSGSTSFRHYQNDPSNPNSISKNKVRFIFEDSKNRLWFGTEGGGLNLYNEEKDVFIRFQASSKPDSLSSNNVITIFEDSKGRIWLGTLGGGLNLFDVNKASFKHFGQAYGLVSSTVSSINEDDEGNLWLGTSWGLYKFDPEREEFSKYDKSNGLQGNLFNFGTTLKTKRGELFFGGSNGLNYFLPNQITKNTRVPQVYVTEIYLFNKKMEVGDSIGLLSQNANTVKAISLEPGQSIFTIKFAALNYLHPGKNQYAYILEGLEEEWNYVGNKNEATYTQLEPGKYTFKVKASNNDGVWLETPTSLIIYVPPPWWKSKWFISISIFTFVAVLVFLYKQRIMNLNRQRMQMEAKVKERTLELNTAYKKIKEKNEEVNSQSEELHQQAEELRITNEQITSLNAALENKVKERTEKLSKTNKELDFFLYRSSHDFRRPLTTLMGISSMAKIYIKEEFSISLFDKVQDTAEKMDIMLQKLTMIHDINNMNELSKAVDFEKILKDIGEQISDLKKKTNTELNFVAETPINFFSKLHFIEIILSNLIENSIYFSGHPFNPNPKIDIMISQAQDGLSIKVVDNGVGIPPDSLPNIYDIYFRGNENSPGNGLGLFVVKKAVERLEGSIHCESTTGKGTTFTIVIPGA